MLIKTSGNIDGDAGIQRVIGTKDDINLPIHGVKQPFQKRNRQLLLAP
jgi:hypothetical protein